MRCAFEMASCAMPAYIISGWLNGISYDISAVHYWNIYLLNTW